jgi:hypothetical protein
MDGQASHCRQRVGLNPKIGAQDGRLLIAVDRRGARNWRIVRVDDHDLKTCQLHAIMEWDETEMAATKPGLAEPLERVCQSTRRVGGALP